MEHNCKNKCKHHESESLTTMSAVMAIIKTELISAHKIQQGILDIVLTNNASIKTVDDIDSLRELAIDMLVNQIAINKLHSIDKIKWLHDAYKTFCEIMEDECHSLEYIEKEVDEILEDWRKNINYRDPRSES